MPPQATATANTPAAFAAAMSNGESPTYAASSGRASSSASACRIGSGCGLWRCVASEPTTTSKYCPIPAPWKTRSTVGRRLADTTPSLRPLLLSRASTSTIPSKQASSEYEGSLCSRYTRTSSSTRPGSRRAICASRFVPPTCARICSSGKRRRNTVSVAWWNDARMTWAESTSVPSRSKRTIGKRIEADASDGIRSARGPRRPPHGRGIVLLPHAVEEHLLRLRQLPGLRRSLHPLRHPQRVEADPAAAEGMRLRLVDDRHPDGHGQRTGRLRERLDLQLARADARLRRDLAWRRFHVHVASDGSHVHQRAAPRLLPQPRALARLLVPRPAIPSGFCPAITLRAAASSVAPIATAMGAPCVLASLGASDPEARKHYWTGH